ncbi:MAG: DNA-directed RNA polymerase subunit N [Candidatus Hodarchaeaceae archaeon]|nr:DNA-directed RNA polymerase subunit N [Candidatus Hodarchaeaceae archaeon]
MTELRPIRCFTCGKLLADKYEQFEERVKKGEEPKKVLDDLELKRYCCRAALLTSVDFMDEIAKFKK